MEYVWGKTLVLSGTCRIWKQDVRPKDVYMVIKDYKESIYSIRSGVLIGWQSDICPESTEKACCHLLSTQISTGIIFIPRVVTVNPYFPLARFRDLQRPEHAPQRPAGIYTCTVVCRRVPCVLRSRDHEKRREAGRETFCVQGGEEKSILHCCSLYTNRNIGVSKRFGRRIYYLRLGGQAVTYTA